MKPVRRFRRAESPDDDAPELPRDGRRRLVVERPDAMRRKGASSPPRRAPGEGWRSVVAGAVTTAALAGLAYLLDVEKVQAVAPWITLALLGVLAGKDIGRVSDAIVAAVTALRSR
jgi:hypothetical protein